MINLVIKSGLHNTTLWAVALAFLVSLVSWLRSRWRDGESGPPLAALRGLLDSPLFLAFVGLGTLFNFGIFGLYRGYVSPRDFMQDVISAQEFLQGRSLYPDNLTALFQTEMRENPPQFSLVRQWPSLYEKEAVARWTDASCHWAQAHPPLMTLYVAPFVSRLGVFGTFFALNLISLGALLLTLMVIRSELGLNLSRRQTASLGLLVLGWAPVVTVFRSCQSGLLLGFLLVLGWSALRRARPVLAGAAIGVATSLKIYPGLLAYYLLLRSRRGFVAAILTILALFTLSLGLCGWQSFVDYSRSANAVVVRYVGYAENLSVLGLIFRTIHRPDGLTLTQPIFLGVGILVAGWLAWLTRFRQADESVDLRTIDLEYVLCMALICLLSPVSWDHYWTILLLPLAVLGERVLISRSSASVVLGFLGLLLILSIPELTNAWLYETLRGSLSHSCLWFATQTVRTLPLPVLCAWLARRALAARTAPILVPALGT